MTMKDRERDFENRFVHDQELKFRIRARRNKLLGLWAAERLGKTSEEAKVYAQEVVRADFELPGDDDVLQKVDRDFKDGKVSATEAEIRAKMIELLAVAEAQVMAE